MKELNSRTDTFSKFNVKKSEIEKIIKNPLLLYAEFVKTGKGKFYFLSIKQKRMKKRK